MRNPYLAQFPELAGEIERMKIHLLGRPGGTFLVATMPGTRLRQVVEATLAWELAETGSLLVEQLTPTNGLIDLLAHNSPRQQPFVISMLLDLPSTEQNRIDAFLSQLNLEREILARQLASVLLWLPPWLLPHFVHRAGDLWAWRSDHYQFELDINLENSRLLTDPAEVRKIAGQMATIERQASQAGDPKERPDLTAQYVRLADQLGVTLPEVETLRQNLSAEVTSPGSKSPPSPLA